MSDYKNVSVADLKRVISLRMKVEALESKIDSILGGAKPEKAPKTTVNGKKVKRRMSAKARAAISKAAKARWAKAKASGKQTL